LTSDRLQNTLEVLEDVIVPEPKDPEALGPQPTVALGIRRAFEMLASVELDDKPPLQAGKVDDV